MTDPSRPPDNTAKPDTEDGKRLANSMKFTFENCVIIFTSIMLLGIATIGFVLSTPGPMVITGTGLIVSTSVQNVYETDYARLDTPKGVQHFRDNANIAEGIWNLGMLVVALAIDAWNYCLHVLYLLYTIFQNYFVMLLKTITAPGAVKLLMDFIGMIAQGLSTGLSKLSIDKGFDFVGGTVNDYQVVYGLDPDQEFGAGDTPTGNPAIPNALGQRFWFLYNFLTDILTQSTDETVGELFNFISAPVIKRLPSIIKFIADLAGLITPGGYWSNYLIGDVSLLQLRSMIDLSTCFGEYLFYDIVCAVEIGVAGVMNGMATTMRVGTPYTPMCREFQIPKHCSLTALSAPVDPMDQSIQSQNLFDFVFSPTQCDEFDCVFFVSDLVSSLPAHNNTCAFWVNSPTAVFDCMLLVADFSDANNTMVSRADPSTLAAEICFVLYVKNAASCNIHGMPFVYASADVAGNVCSTGNAGVSISNCTCAYNAPLCNSGCCSTYAEHVRDQTLAQIGDRTCAELYSDYPRDKVWCPLVTGTNRTDSSPFVDNTYTHMWCAFYDDVVGNLCTFVSGFTQLSDLGIASVYSNYATSACNRTVNQQAVCVPLNSTVDQLAIDIILGEQALTTIDTFIANDQITYTPNVPIVTQFLPSDDASSIRDKTRRKHFCQQFSEANKNDNLMLKSKPWRVKSHASNFCDKQVLAATFDVNIAASTFSKYADTDGNPIAVELSGVPDTWPAFGELINPNLQRTVCTAPVGPNVVEANAFEACMQRLRQQYYEQGASQSRVVSDTLTLWSQQSAYMADFIFLNGVYPIDPSDPEYDQKVIELERLVRMLNIDLNYTATAYGDLASLAPPWRTNVTEVPAEDSIDNDDPSVPFPQLQSINPPPGSRILLSVNTDTGPTDVPSPLPPAPNYYAVFKQLLAKTFPAWKRAKTRPEAAREYKTKRRLHKVGEVVYNKLYTAPQRDYAARGQDVDNVDFFPETRAMMRKLAMTGDPAKDAFVTEVLGAFATTPTEPVGMTKQAFKLFLKEDIYNQFAYLYDATVNVAVPGIYRSLVRLIDGTYVNDANAYYGAEYSFEGEFGTASKRCISTMSEPYKCCLAASNSYECCYGLIGCIPVPPVTWYQEKTTSENCAARWKCAEMKSFVNWWKYAIQTAVYGFYSILVFFLGHADTYKPIFSWAMLSDHPPRNFVFCMTVHSINLFMGVFIVFAAYLLFASQGLYLLIANMTRFQEEQVLANNMQIQNNKAKIAELKANRNTHFVDKYLRK